MRICTWVITRAHRLSSCLPKTKLPTFWTFLMILNAISPSSFNTSKSRLTMMKKRTYSFISQRATSLFRTQLIKVAEFLSTVLQVLVAVLLSHLLIWCGVMSGPYSKPLSGRKLNASLCPTVALSLSWKITQIYWNSRKKTPKLRAKPSPKSRLNLLRTLMS